jgi:hypothetical protein
MQVHVAIGEGKYSWGEWTVGEIDSRCVKPGPDLRETAQALRYARLMLRGCPDPKAPVMVFDGSIITSVAVSAPEVMVQTRDSDPAAFRRTCRQ